MSSFYNDSLQYLLYLTHKEQWEVTYKLNKIDYALGDKHPPYLLGMSDVAMAIYSSIIAVSNELGDDLL
jgi:phage-related protein